MCGVVGEPGVGKSRLVWEFTHSHRAQGWLVLEAGSVSYGKATRYLPVIDLSRATSGSRTAITYRDIREKVTGKLLTLDESLLAMAPAFLALLDVPGIDPQWQGSIPAAPPADPRRRQAALLLRESQVQPLLVVFEDLHWIDAETQALLDRLVESLPTARLSCWSTTGRSTARLGRKTYYTQLRLDPLLPESAEDLLDVAARATIRRLDPLKRPPDRADRGEPLLPRGERADPGRDEGPGRGARRLPPGQISPRDPGAGHRPGHPGGSHRPAAARGQAPAPDRGGHRQGRAAPLLQAIADFPETALRAMARAPPGRRVPLRDQPSSPRLEYTFKHALTHEVAYGRLLQERRRALHARIVEAIERLYEDRLAEHVDRLAHHALRGEAWSKAVAYLRQAAARAAARSAHREAVAHLEQALVARASVPRGAASGRSRRSTSAWISGRVLVEGLGLLVAGRLVRPLLLEAGALLVRVVELRERVGELHAAGEALEALDQPVLGGGGPSRTATAPSGSRG